MIIQELVDRQFEVGQLLNWHSPFDLEVSCKLGEGAYGSVHKATIVQSGQVVAVKTVKLTDQDEGISSTTIRELSILQTLDHPNIIKMLHYRLLMTSLSPRVEMIFEYMDQDLGKRLKREKKLLPEEVKSILHQILLGVRYMHSQNVFHRDLKPQNVLINNQNQVKIADFGLGRIVGCYLNTMSKEIETLWYRSPELLLGTTRYDLSVDVWSIGCIFYELAEGEVLFQTESEIGQIFEIMKLLGNPSMKDNKAIDAYPLFKHSFPKFPGMGIPCSNLSLTGIDLLTKMVCFNPKERITVNEALQHRLLCDILNQMLVNYSFYKEDC